ncbi:hypothetical protein IJH89_02915 [Candidatus Saccharibacteria bacterium]|nr:hypothetical protein [Candidatus Saccharibacteria bacterium]
MTKSPKNLPRLNKEELKERRLKDEKSDSPSDKSRTLWIVVLAFAILAVFGAIVWFVFSGRSDQKIHGDNLDSFTSEEPVGPLAPGR